MLNRNPRFDPPTDRAHPPRKPAPQRGGAQALCPAPVRREPIAERIGAALDLSLEGRARQIVRQGPSGLGQRPALVSIPCRCGRADFLAQRLT